MEVKNYDLLDDEKTPIAWLISGVVEDEFDIHRDLSHRKFYDAFWEILDELILHEASENKESKDKEEATKKSYDVQVKYLKTELKEAQERVREWEWLEQRNAKELKQALGRIAELEGAIETAIDKFETMDVDGHRAHNLEDIYVDDTIRSICESRGYGAVMDSVARQWFLKDNDGAFVTGPCALVARNGMSALRDALQRK